MSKAWDLAIAGMTSADRKKAFADEFERRAQAMGREHEYFTNNEVKAANPDCHPHHYGLHYNAAGNQTRRWLRAGWCKQVGTTRAKTPVSHAHPCYQLKSLIFKGRRHDRKIYD